MGLWSRVTRMFDRSDRAPATPPDLHIDDLSERLRLMRGNVTTPMPPAAAPPRSADAVQRLSRAARDARYVDRTNEDDVLREVTTYRSIDDR